MSLEWAKDAMGGHITAGGVRFFTTPLKAATFNGMFCWELDKWGDRAMMAFLKPRDPVEGQTHRENYILQVITEFCDEYTVIGWQVPGWYGEQVVAPWTDPLLKMMASQLRARLISELEKKHIDTPPQSD